jgi:hypothetical protein
MCIILICALFLVGFLNTNIPNKDHLSAINNDNKRLGISSSVFYNMVEEKYSTANLITDASTNPMLLAASSRAVEFSSKDNSFTSPVQTVQYQIMFLLLHRLTIIRRIQLHLYLLQQGKTPVQLRN